MLDGTLIEVITLDHSIIPTTCIRKLDEQLIKVGGEIWMIHKNDKDPFPSSPHAHNKETGLKLDLTNGNLFFKGKDTKHSISKKDLLIIRGKIKNLLLPALAI